MENLVKFIKEYEKLKLEYPELYFSISETRKYNLFRIKIFAYNMGDRGDAELVSCESPSREEALAQAIIKMESIPLKIDNLTEFKTGGHRLLKSAAV